MREIHEKQVQILVPAVDHPVAKELEVISDVLDAEPRAADLVLQDLAGTANVKNGRPGMSGDRVLRALILKMSRGFSYEELSFHLQDSRTFRWFCRLGIDEPAPCASTLQANISVLEPETLRAVNDLVRRYASEEGIEPGDKIRTDCTVVESNIHPPTDSSLLFDVVKTCVRLLEHARELVADIRYSNHTRASKKRVHRIQYARRKKKRRKPYRVLIRYTRKSLSYVEAALERSKEELGLLAAEMERVLELGRRVIDQTVRRVFEGEKVPATEKIVSIFEPHSDIIIKDWRHVFYGHKVCLSAGVSGMITDCVVETGNPADSTLVERTLDRHVALFGAPPRQFTCDGGFSSRSNLEYAKDLGVRDVCFTKSPGLEVDEMVSKPWIYRQLQKFRAGVESCIAFLKLSFGMSRCDWRGWKSFRRYVQSSVLACNLVVLARKLLE